MPPGITTTSPQHTAERIGEAAAEPALSSAAAPVSPPSDEVQTALGLNRGDRRVVTVLIVVALLLMIVHWYRLTQSRPEPVAVLHPEGYVFQLDVNTATWVEWMQLDGVGEVLARRIVEDRQQRGPFASLDELQRVKGIGPVTLAGLRPHLTCAVAAGSSAPSAEGAHAE